MKMIRKIALAELRYLFYSPIAWFVIVAFYVLNAVFFFDWLTRMASALDAGKEAMDNHLGWVGGIVKSMHFDVTRQFFKYLHLFLALLTMGIISREINTGSIKLLYSSPVRNRDIIVGKYLGIVLFSFIFLLGTALLMFTGIVIVDISFPPEFLSILIALFLVINTYAAIGLFFSCITNYQIVAAVFTFLLLYLLDSILDFGQKYDFVRTVTHLLTTRFKASQIYTGLLTSKNLLYYGLMIAMFLLFAMIRLRSTRVANHWRTTAFQYISVFLVTLLIGYVSSRPGFIFYKDLTKKQINTLHPSTQEVIRKFDGSPIKVTLYVNLLQRLEKFGFPEQRFIYMAGFWDEYLRFYPNIQFDYVYYYAIKDGDSTLYKQYPGKNIDEIAAIKTEIFGERTSLFKPGTSLDNFHELEKEDFKAIMKVEYKNRHTYIRTIAGGGGWPHQINMAGGLMRLLRDTNVAITFLSGNLERSPFRNTPRDYGGYATQKFSTHSLIERGVDVDTISVKENDIPKDVQVLVIADPRIEYTPIELERIHNYIERGGNAIIFAEPGKQYILNPLLNKLGVVAEEGILIKNDQYRHLVTGTKTTKSLTMSRELERFVLFPSLGNEHLHDAATMLSYRSVDGFEVEPIFSTNDKKVWLRKGAYVRDSIAPAFNKEEGDLRLDEYTIGVALTRKIANKEQRILIAGDADFMSTRAIDPEKLNHHFYSWALNNAYPIYDYYPFGDDRFLKVNRDQVEGMMIVYVYVIPVIIFFTAFGLLMRRRKK